MILSREQAITQNLPINENSAFKEEEPEQLKVDWLDVQVSQLERNNVVSSFIAKYDDYPTEAKRDDQWDYNLGMPNEYVGTDKELLYLDTSNQEQSDWVSRNIKREERNARIESEGGIGTFAAGLFAAATSPESAIAMAMPVASILSKTAKARIGIGIAKESGVAGVATAAGEFALHQSQSERTIEESVFTVGATVVFAGIISGLGKGMSEFSAGAKELDNIMATIDSKPAISKVGPEQPKSASAAETMEELPQILEAKLQKKYDDEVAAGRMKQVEADVALRAERADLIPAMSKAKNPQLYRFLGYISPITRLATSEGHEARTLSAQLLTSPLQQVSNQFGGGVGHSVELMSDFLTYETTLNVKNVTASAFKHYKSVLKEKGEKGFNRREFNAEISKALRDGDVHGDKVVEQTAQKMRSAVMKPLEDRMLKMGMLKKDYDGFENIKASDLDGLIEPEKLAKLKKSEFLLDADKVAKLPNEVKEVLEAQGKLSAKAKLPTGDKGYLHRVYDFNKIENNKEAFEDTLTAIFRERGLSIIDKNIAKKEQDLFELEQLLEVSRDSAKGMPKQTSRQLDAKKKKQITDLKAELSRLKTTEKQYSNNLLKMAREKNATDWVAFEKLQEKIDVKRAAIKEKYAGIRQVKGEVLSDADKLAEAKWQLDIAVRGREAQVTVLESQLLMASREVRHAILGDNYNPGMPLKTFKAGPLKDRVINIPSNQIDDWLSNDIEEVMSKYMLDIAPRISMREKFDFVGGDIEEHMQSKINSALAEYDDMSRQALSAGDTKRVKKLAKQRNRVKEDLGASFELLLNRYRLPENPNSFLEKAGQELRKFQFTTKLGMMTVSAIPDLGSIIMRRGLGGTARYMKNFLSMSKAIKAQHEVARAANVGIDLATNERGRRLFLNDTINPLSASNKFQNITDKAVDVFGKASLMPYWNSGLKTVVGSIYSDEVLKNAIKALNGTLDKKSIARFAQNGLLINDLKAIAKAFNKQTGKKTEDGVHLADLTQWDQSLATKYKLTIMNETEKTIITPGKGDLPLISHSFVGKLVFQFKSFAISANNRILLASLDDMTAQKAVGAISMIGLGSMSYIIRETLKGNEPKTDTRTLINEGMERSGLFSFWTDANSMVEKATAGDVHAGAAMEKMFNLEQSGMSSRYMSRNMLGSFLGVNAGTFEDTFKVATAIARGDWKESDIRAVRRNIYMNNLWALHAGFTKMEQAAGGK